MFNFHWSRSLKRQVQVKKENENWKVVIRGPDMSPNMKQEKWDRRNVHEVEAKTKKEKAEKKDSNKGI